MFVTDFLQKLDATGLFDRDQLRVIERTLQIHSNDYDINEKSTQVVPYSGRLPDCYKAFMVSKKIEGLSEATLKMYKYHIERFLFAVGKHPQQMTTNDVRAYLYSITDYMTERYADNIRIVLHGFFAWLAEENYIDKNICKPIRKIKYETKERHPLTMEELVKVRAACKTNRERALIEVLYSTGCRVSELCGLKLSDIDFTTRECRLFGKGKKHRSSYINATALFFLRNYLLERQAHGSEDGKDYVFVSDRNPHQALKKRGIEKIVHTLGERAGLSEPLFPHRIRHSTATHALNRGMDITEVQRLLGHTSTETTLIYAKIAQDEVKRAHEKCIV